MRATSGWILVALMAAACGGGQRSDSAQPGQRRLGMRERSVRHQAAFDFNCPEEQVDVVTISSFNASFGARGCGKRASYTWNSYGGVQMNSPVMVDEAAPAAAPAPAPAPAPAAAPAAAPAPAQ